MKANIKNKKTRNQKTLLRIGFGYDVHRLVEGRKLIIGGIQIPSKVGLLGHSDADVLLHAICDALLGAAALGDIGQHFPDTSSKYHNISSHILLKKVGIILHKKGYLIGNIDSTLILEYPKISPYKNKMCNNIAKALGILKNQVSVKATTNEGLGSLGRAEGCSAFAVATIILKDRIS